MGTVSAGELSCRGTQSEQVKDRILEKLSAERQSREGEIASKVGDGRTGGHCKAGRSIFPSPGRREELEDGQPSHKWPNY